MEGKYLRRAKISIDGNIIGRTNTLKYVGLGSTQPLTKMSTKNFPEGKRRWPLKAENLTGICEPIV
jgi:hypothetical protein